MLQECSGEANLRKRCARGTVAALDRILAVPVLTAAALEGVATDEARGGVAPSATKLHIAGFAAAPLARCGPPAPLPPPPLPHHAWPCVFGGDLNEAFWPRRILG